MNLPSLVRYHRKAADLSQIELAELANVSRKVVQCIESGGEHISLKNVQAVLLTLKSKSFGAVACVDEMSGWQM